jgi:hypothetical protein
LLVGNAEPFGGLLTVDDGQPDLLVDDGLELGLLRAGGGLVRRLLLGKGAGDHHQRIGGGGGGGVASDGSRAVSPRGGAGALVAPAMQLVVPGISNLCPPRMFL